MKNYYVYKHTNLINGKVYIGMSCQKTYDRWNESKYLRHKKFGSAIQEFGWKNFSHEILFNNLTKEEAEKLEKETIAFYKSNNEKFGYNMITGGIGGGVGAKPVKCNKTEIIYESAREAERQTGISRTSIGRCCRGKQKTAGGSTWEFVN